MIKFSDKIKYVIWGTGVHAAQFLYDNPYINNIEFFIDNNVVEEGREFCGKKVLRFCEIEKHCTENYFFIVAVSEKVYLEIKQQLQEMEYKEFDDFAFYQFFYKKIVILHGNCHMDIIREFLKSSERFVNGYVIYQLPLIQCIGGKIDDKTLENCDLFIHQDIQANNEFGYELSDEYILPRLRKECVKITVPNLYGLGRGFFQQMVWNERNYALCGGRDTNGFFPYADIIIDRAVTQGKSVEEILAIMQSQVFTAEEIQNNFELYMDKIKKREQNWDIPIYNFIVENYKKHKLFYDPGHPTNVVMKEITLGILKIIGIEEEALFCDRKMNSLEVLVYDVVRETLEMEWEDNEVRKGKWAKKLRMRMTKEEYVKEYLFWCYGIRD